MDMPVEPTLLESSDELLENIENHFKVIAGPGAGKTRWLSNHIKNVLSNSQRLNKCRKIACITYTNVGVKAIIKRLGDSLDKVEVSTIHSFLYEHIVKPYIFLVSEEHGLNPAKIDGHEDLVPTAGLIHSWKGKTKQLYLNDEGAIVKALCATCWQFGDAGEELELKFRNAWSGSVGTYNIRTNSLIEYKKIFWERNQLHHDDVLYFSYILLKKEPAIFRILRDKFPYFFVDEFQDTNPIQTKIIKMLSEEETIVGIIGDNAQSIYKFQGADVTQFDEFTLPNMISYKIENNHRSTEEILYVLNSIRTNISQSSPEDKHGEKPLILIGNKMIALEKAKELASASNVCSLSYTNVTSCEMKSEYSGAGTEDLLLKLRTVDRNGDRKKIIPAIIKSIEYARQNKFKDAIKQVAKYCKKADNFKGQKTALSIIHKMLENYDTYSNGGLVDFYTTLKTAIDGVVSIANIRMTGESAIKTFYEETTYKDLILWIRYNDDDSLHRTIHKAKGDEFDNVLIVLKDDGESFNQETKLSFLLTPDLEKEEHRIYYVALSRAKKRLFVHVPELSDENKTKLEQMGFGIKLLAEETTNMTLE
jgi:DNA helicase-2/ATP-dependent DNA helicase PcrA